MRRSNTNQTRLALLALFTVLFSGTSQAEEAKLAVCATVPDLGDLARIVGGNDVQVTVLTKGPQDPHTIVARPSFVRSIHNADVFVAIGLELEVGWAPQLLRTARNPRVRPGGEGYVDASRAVQPLAVPKTPVSRAMGDVHGHGNPHYLLDPLNGLRVATLLAKRFSDLRPEKREAFAERLDAFRTRVAESLFGKELVNKYKREDVPKLLKLLERGGVARFVNFLEKEKQKDLLGGWVGALWPYYGTRCVADHDTWPYLTGRFGLEVVAFLEPKPGLTPTTRHLGQVIRGAREQKVAAVLSCAYFNPRHAEFVAHHAGTSVVEMAHQSGSRKGADGYVGVFDYNVRQLVNALEKSRLGGEP